MSTGSPGGVSIQAAWLGRVEREVDYAQGEPEFAMVDADDEQAAGVRSARGCPFGRDAGKVGDVEGDHHPCLFGGEREQSVVVAAIEFAFLVGRADVVLRA